MYARLKSKLPFARAWILFVALVLGSPTALAQSSLPSDPCVEDPSCKELIEQARSLSYAGQHDAALVSYQTAYGRQPVSWLLFNIARIQHRLGRLEQAVISYQRFLKESSAPGDEILRKKAAEYAQDAEQELNQRRRAASGASVPLPPKPVPIYKKWWLWAAILGGTAVVATGVGLGLGLRPKDPKPPDGDPIFDRYF